MTTIPTQFQKFNFHDSTIENIEIIPSISYGRKKAKIILIFKGEDGKNYKLQFTDCRNIQLSADFDLLKDNSGFGNTSHSEATYKPKKLIKLIKEIEQISNIEYEGIKSPVEKKIEKIDQFTCFIIYFFGGTLKVIGKNFKSKKPNNIR